MKIKETLQSKPIPAWLYAMATVLYCELLFHFWITDAFNLPRFAAVLAFALGFGGVLSQITSFLGHKTWGKWVSAALVGIVSVFYIVEYFVLDAYMTFMPMGTLLGGAEGVATGFGDVVMGLVVRDFWRIIVILLPTLLFALFAKPVETSWRSRWFGLALAVAAYLAGFGIVNAVGTDAAQMGKSYNFDGAVRCFGVNMAFTLDAVKEPGEEESEDSFVILEPMPTQAPAVPEETVDATVPEETEPVVDRSPNVLNVDYNALAEGTYNSRVATIHRYVAAQTPSNKNEYTGLFAGKNLIIITAEAFAKEVIDPELTPTLYRLANEGIQFKEYYQPLWGGSTSTGEFSVLSGLVAANGVKSMMESKQQEMFLTIGKQLQRQGYHSAAYHNHLYSFYDRHLTHTGFGYETYMGIGNGLEEGVNEHQWPQSDEEMFLFTVDQYIDQQPFSIYYMTVSGHGGYSFDTATSKKNKDAVEGLEWSDKIRAYLASQLELEYGLTHLMNKLEEKGILDDTVIVLTADHYPYCLEYSTTWNNKKDYIGELYGYAHTNCAERDHNGLIIWSGCIEDMDLVVEEPTYSLDILPTLSNLFGVEYDSRLLVGRDVFSEEEPLVLWPDHSWVTEKGTYISRQGKFIPKEGEEVDEAYLERIHALVQNKIHLSKEIQQANYYGELWKQMNASEAE